MNPFPLALADIFGHWGSYGVYLLIGIAFGAVLEMAGFGNSKKLAAQFYFSEMTVLKVMFTAIVVAMVLIFLASGLGLLDYNLVWVNPTYLVPGIVGGLLMGVGFIVGGFCPGTSLVAAATLKLDGVFFVLGVFFGIFLFGETVGSYEDFWFSTDMGRYTLPELFGVSTGVVVVGVVVMALGAFWAAEQAERIVGGVDLKTQPKWRYYAAGGVLLLGFGSLLIGQPTTEDRWDWVAEEKQALLDERQVQIHPAEVMVNMEDDKITVMPIDVRSESDFNKFHILDAVNIPLADIPDAIPDLIEEPGNTLFVLISNDETAATDVWKTLTAESVHNVYILEGGINNWLDLYTTDEFKAEHPRIEVADDELAYTFTSALGARYAASFPDIHAFEYEYVEKVIMETKRAPGSGGCG